MCNVMKHNSDYTSIAVTKDRVFSLLDITRIAVTKDRVFSLLDITRAVVTKKQLMGDIENNTTSTHSAQHPFEAFLVKNITKGNAVAVATDPHFPEASGKNMPFIVEKPLLPDIITIEDSPLPDIINFDELPFPDIINLEKLHDPDSSACTTPYASPPPCYQPRQRQRRKLTPEEFEELMRLDIQRKRELEARIQFDYDAVERLTAEQDELIMARARARERESKERKEAYKKECRELRERERAYNRARIESNKRERAYRKACKANVSRETQGKNSRNTFYQPTPTRRREYGCEEGNRIFPVTRKRKQVFFENCVIEGCGGEVFPLGRIPKNGVYFCDEHKNQYRKRTMKEIMQKK
jgi:hypothetical protein